MRQAEGERQKEKERERGRVANTGRNSIEPKRVKRKKAEAKLQIRLMQACPVLAWGMRDTAMTCSRKLSS